MDIQVNDDVILKIKNNVIIEVFEYEDFDLDNPIEELFNKDEKIEVTICGIDEHKFDVQFGDGSIAFIRRDLVEVVSVN